MRKFQHFTYFRLGKAIGAASLDFYGQVHYKDSLICFAMAGIFLMILFMVPGKLTNVFLNAFSSLMDFKQLLVATSFLLFR